MRRSLASAGRHTRASGAGPRLLILGTRGVPAAHGGFETFAERLALDLVARGWTVAVYCQRHLSDGRGRWQDHWRGIERINIAVGGGGPASTLLFDWLCVRDAAARDGVCLVLGYNGAAFLPYLRLRGRPVITNMDGIEWQRPKWGVAARTWFYVNEWVAARASHRLIADHPEIARQLAARHPAASVVTIPYGGDPVTEAAEAPVRALGLVPDRYFLSVSRIEPDNSILPMVRAFCRDGHGFKLVVVGDVATAYGRTIREAANGDVLFPGSIYDAAVLRSLRFHARAYLHGHRVGGTNPSLVEALWAGSAVVAHDNPFNRWTAGAAALFFRDADECAARIAAVAHQPERVAELRRHARLEATARFAWSDIVTAYERQLLQLAARTENRGRGPLRPLRQGGR